MRNIVLCARSAATRYSELEEDEHVLITCHPLQVMVQVNYAKCTRELAKMLKTGLGHVSEMDLLKLFRVSSVYAFQLWEMR